MCAFFLVEKIRMNEVIKNTLRNVYKTDLYDDKSVFYIVLVINLSVKP